MRTRLVSLVSLSLSAQLLSSCGAYDPAIDSEGVSVGTVDQELVLAAAVAPTVNVIVTLKNQPVARLEALQKKYHPELVKLRDDTRKLHRSTFAKAAQSVGEGEERRMVAARPPLTPLVKKQFETLLTQVDDVRQRMRKEAFQNLSSAVVQEQTALKALIISLGGTPGESTPVTNAIAARVPSSAVAKLTADPRVESVSIDRPAEEELNVSASSVSAGTFWSAGFNGGIWDVGICDNGVDKSHPALSGHDFYGDVNLPGGSGHGTHVAGIVASTNATHKGIAFGLDAIVSKRCSSESTVMSGFDWMIRSSPKDADVGNISQGYGTVSVDSTALSRYFDALVDGLDFMVAKSTGNNGNGGATATITYPANSYNLLAVANMDDKGTTSRLDDRINPGSSQGPTPNGRKKPDIAAPGTAITSSIPGSGFGSKTGTSMAAPHVAGAVLLLMDAGVYKPASAKAILINTADAWGAAGKVQGSSWNKVYGWGYLDLWEAHYNHDDVFEDTVGSTIFGGGNAKHVYEGRMYSYEKATLVWNRRAVANGPNAPTTFFAHNKIHLIMRDKLTNAIIASSTSNIDNVQQVHLPPAYNGRVVRLEVLSKELLINGGGNQEYSLATEENFTKIQ
jgi:serine protease AprX